MTKMLCFNMNATDYGHSWSIVDFGSGFAYGDSHNDDPGWDRGSKDGFGAGAGNASGCGYERGYGWG